MRIFFALRSREEVLSLHTTPRGDGRLFPRVLEKAPQGNRYWDGVASMEDIHCGESSYGCGPGRNSKDLHGWICGWWNHGDKQFSSCPELLHEQLMEFISNILSMRSKSNGDHCSGIRISFFPASFSRAMVLAGSNGGKQEAPIIDIRHLINFASGILEDNLK